MTNPTDVGGVGAELEALELDGVVIAAELTVLCKVCGEQRSSSYRIDLEAPEEDQKFPIVDTACPDCSEKLGAPAAVSTGLACGETLDVLTTDDTDELLRQVEAIAVELEEAGAAAGLLAVQASPAGAFEDGRRAAYAVASARLRGLVELVRAELEEEGAGDVDAPPPA